MGSYGATQYARFSRGAMVESLSEDVDDDVADHHGDGKDERRASPTAGSTRE
jgi:hypothetical protein